LGFEYVYLTPIHPIGIAARKGSSGSPYAIRDFRSVDPALGGESGFRAFLDSAHGLGLGVIVDVVYNHTSPDSLLAANHPEWFHRNADGRPEPRVEEWSDVVDLDYSSPGMREYQIETLERWVRFGVDGFRCDVASLVPTSFWIEARSRVSAVRPVLWLAESVHKEFVVKMRRMGIPVCSDTELHRAFDLSYDYDGRQDLESAWSGSAPRSDYLRHLVVQEALYPECACKLRFLENHDQERAARRFGRAEGLRNWTAFAMLLPGAFMAYMGEEEAIAARPSLFDPDPVAWNSGSPEFRAFFGAFHAYAKDLKIRAPVSDMEEIAAGVVLARRSTRGGKTVAVAILNLDGRSGCVELPSVWDGKDPFTGESLKAGLGFQLPREPFVLEIQSSL
jgi:glycosidase